MMSVFSKILVLLFLVLPLSACGTAAVVGTGAAYVVTKTAVKTTYGAAKLAGKGVVAAGRALVPDEDDPDMADNAD